MQKASLRREMLLKRQSYLPEEVERRSQQICQQFFKFFPVSKLRVIHVFLPIVAKKEVNTWCLVDYLRVHFPAVRIAVPVTDSASPTLAHYFLSPETQLEVNKWGIPEPVNAPEVPVSALDMVLVPLLAFDEKGHRVGYGKGYYDRFLNFCQLGTIAVGLSLEEQPVPLISNTHAGDVALPYVVTPSKVYQFT